MKKLILILCCLIIFNNISYSYECDVTFPTEIIRKGHTYKFYDDFDNNYLSQIQFFNVYFTEQGDINGGINLDFKWTQSLVNDNYLVNSGITESIVESEPYFIKYNPVIRQSGNLLIAYEITYREKVNGVIMGPYTQVECKPYEISWCGDGIIDSTDGETCDPADTSNTGWGTRGCTSSCQPDNGGGGGSSLHCASFTFGTGTGGIDTLVSPASPNTTRNIAYNGNTLEIPITCGGNRSSIFTYVDCGNSTLLQPVFTSGRTATFTCTYNSNANITYTPRCYVGSNDNSVNETSDFCTGRVAIGTGGGGGTPGTCGDGIVQSPNSHNEYEECDFGTDINGLSNSACSEFCTLNGGGNGQTDGIITVPDDGEIILSPDRQITIGDNINPFEQILTFPSIINNSSFDIMFRQLCVHLKSGNSFNTNSLCKEVGRLTPGEKVVFDNYTNFISDVSSIAGNFEDNILVTTINNLTNAYFAGELEIRVSRPSIVTTGGGTSFINQSSTIADINDVAIIEKDKNNNFVGAGISDNLSSETKNIDEAEIINDISKEGEDNNKLINENIIVNDGINDNPSINISDFGFYNGMENVFILKDREFTLSSDITGDGSKTYIIENKDLIINSNILYPENIAFVVKGGNIIINSNVTEINGVYISIPKDVDGAIVGGNIKGVNTKNILTVNGSLYGDLTELVKNRTYIEEVNGYLNVGTIVSFGSSIFRQPAPLTGKFIGEYMDSQKVAK